MKWQYRGCSLEPPYYVLLISKLSDYYIIIFYDVISYYLRQSLLGRGIMKKLITIFLILLCIIGINIVYNYKRLDPNVKLVEDMTILKMKPNPMLSLDKVCSEKDKKKIVEIISALKNRSRENNTGRLNSYNYALDIRVKDKKYDFVGHRYAIWIEQDNVYITIPAISDKSYKLHPDSAKIIIEYLKEVNYKEP